MQSGRATVYNEGATVESVDRLQTSTHAIGLPDAPVPEATLVHPQTTDHTLGPVAKLLGNRFPRFSSWWDSGSVSTPVKLMLLAIAGMIAIKQSDWLLPSALGVGLIYLIYYSVFSSTQNPKSHKALAKNRKKTVKEGSQAAENCHVTNMAQSASAGRSLYRNRGLTAGQRTVMRGVKLFGLGVKWNIFESVDRGLESVFVVIGHGHRLLLGGDLGW